MPLVELQPFERSDFRRLIEWLTSPDLLVEWGEPLLSYPVDRIQLEPYLEVTEQLPTSRLMFKAVCADSGEIVGHVELDRIDAHNRSAEICHLLVGDPDLRGRGYGTEILRQVVDYGFHKLRLHRLEARLFDRNEAALACFCKLYFVKEGYLRDVRRVGEGYRSMHLLSLLESEWPPRELT